MTHALDSFRSRASAVAASALVAVACNAPPAATTSATWLAAEPAAQAAQLERQLRGLDVAMIEAGYRYVELYWAGHDGNWQAAAYQAEKMRLAIENGLERRPKRAASARPFLAGPLTGMAEAAAARDPKLFARRFEALTAGCNSCHVQEKVPFFEVRLPDHRLSPLRQLPAGAAAPVDR